MSLMPSQFRNCLGLYMKLYPTSTSLWCSKSLLWPTVSRIKSHQIKSGCTIIIYCYRVWSIMIDYCLLSSISVYYIIIYYYILLYSINLYYILLYSIVFYYHLLLSIIYLTNAPCGSSNHISSIWHVIHISDRNPKANITSSNTLLFFSQ